MATFVVAVTLPSAIAPVPVDELVGGAGRVPGLDRVVDERLVRVLQQLLVGLVADPARELVVVVGRQADHREDLAVLRVHRDDRAALDADLAHRPPEGLLGVLLGLRVDRERERIARLRLADRLQDLDPAARGVALDALGAVDPAQLRLVGRLEAGLADEVVREVARRLERRRVARPRRARCSRGAATSAGRRCSCGAPRPRPRRRAGPSPASAMRQRRGLVHVVGDPDEVERRARVAVDRRVDVGRVDAGQRREAANDLLAAGLRQVGRADLDRVRGDVRDQQPAVPVVDEAARRRDGLRGPPDSGPTGSRTRCHSRSAGRTAGPSGRRRR